MRTIAVNSDHDIYIGSDGNLAMAEGLEAVLQQCEQAASIRLNELPYAQSKGIPFFENVFTDSPDLALYEMYLRKQFLGVPEVTGVKQIGFKQDGDVLSYEAIIQTTFGTGAARGSI